MTSAVCAADARELGLDRARISGLFRPVSGGGRCRSANPWRHRARDVEGPRNGRAGGAASSSRTRARPKPGRHFIAGPKSLGSKPAPGLTHYKGSRRDLVVIRRDRTLHLQPVIQLSPLRIASPCWRAPRTLAQTSLNKLSTSSLRTTRRRQQLVPDTREDAPCPCRRPGVE
jgi:hypothetical protein